MKKEYFLMTIDVEDWFQVENLRPACPIDTWDLKELRVEKNISRILELFEEMDIKATFFVLGWIAKKCPSVVKNIKKFGHEVASHGYWHRMCTDIDARSLKEDLKKSKDIIEGITGGEVYGFRAPNFSINGALLELLMEEGFSFDSSYNSFSLNSRYGRLNSRVKSNKNGILILESGLVEIPISNLEIKKKVFPMGGGGYFRLFPLFVFKWGIKNILRQRGWYMFYMHPWEIDPGQPRITSIPYNHKFRHYINLDKTFDRLKQMITYFKKRGVYFLTCSQFLNLAL